MENERTNSLMKDRYSHRASVQCSLVVTTETLTGEGLVLDVSVPGCLVESAAPLKAGEYCQLSLSLPAPCPLIRVALAAVRWQEGTRFGVEFIRMHELDRSHLNRFVTQRNASPS